MNSVNVPLQDHKTEIEAFLFTNNEPSERESNESPCLMARICLMAKIWGFHGDGSFHLWSGS